MKIKNPVMALFTSWALLSPASPGAAPAADPAGGACTNAAPAAYIRIQSTEPGRRALETATRTLVPADGKGPVIRLVGVTHIGNADYYAAIQKILDEQSMVLYEGVGRPDFVTGRPQTDEERARWTRSAGDFLAEAYAWHQDQFKAWPADAAALMTAINERRSRECEWLAKAGKDGWNHPWQVELAGEKPRIGSLGSDGKQGGEGSAADLWVEIARKDNPSGVGDIQASIAKALGLKYQLDAIQYNRPHFTNSDMTMNELKTALKKNGADGQEQQLIQMLEGMPQMGALVQGFLNVIGQSPQMQAMVRAMMIEVLGSSDDLMSSDAITQGPMGRMMSVLVVDRNQVVMQDLRRALDSKPARKSIALFYGAGHMADMERTITRELSYRPAETVWNPAFDVRMSDTGVSDAQWNALRGVIQSQMRPPPAPSSP